MQSVRHLKRESFASKLCSVHYDVVILAGNAKNLGKIYATHVYSLVGFKIHFDVVMKRRYNEFSSYAMSYLASSMLCVEINLEN